MAIKIGKYNGSGTHKRAILHMIGQYQDMFSVAPKVSEIAAFMNVSKPTAMKYINRMIENRELIKSSSDYRPNVKMFRFALHEDMLDEYFNHAYYSDYQWYVQRVLKIVLMEVKN